MRLGLHSLIASGVLACGVTAASAETLPMAQIAIDTASGSKTFTVEIAADAASQMRGLMHRSELPHDAGMLFDMHRDAPVAFWMKNTELPLDMLFIRADGTVATIAPNATPYSTALVPSAVPVRAVLEINAGQAAALGIRPGDKVRAAIFGR
ncbi:MAG: DUF192 domain-containing protein [Alphaproteobacteria bacterium]|nr:DUF192 domain-containing protein [Alphaproteobacteria bacterium]